jgi:rhodanese-related sulfurtransferase
MVERWQKFIHIRHSCQSTIDDPSPTIRTMTVPPPPSPSPTTDAPSTGARTTNAVTAIPAAPPADALSFFSNLSRHETDCWDVHAVMAAAGGPDGAGFVLLDVRGPGAWRAGHIDGAVHLPHAEIDEPRLAPFGPDTLFVVYCAGPHCNGADRAAVRLASLGRPVKKMIGGVQGWLDEGFSLASDRHRSGSDRED